jgi:hypothetical protein
LEFFTVSDLKLAASHAAYVSAKSCSEIGASLGISKQAAHKLAHAALTTPAKSGCGVSPQAVPGASRHQSFSPQVDDFPPHP